MKVGILTYHWVSNFGANLQTLSTYKFVEKMGNTPIIINWVPNDVKSFYDNTVSAVQNRAHNEFGLNWFKNITDICRDSIEIAKQIDDNEIDIVLIGSDAVFTMTPWLSRFAICRKGFVYRKPLSNFAFPNPFYGEFFKYVKRPIKIAAISASAQNTPYNKIIFNREKSSIMNALNIFSSITVRDIWTQKMLAHVSRGKLFAEITPDPVFGFNNNVQPVLQDYVRKTLNIKGDYVLLSVFATVKDSDWILQLESLFNAVDIKVVGLPKTLNKDFKSPLKYNLSFPIDPMDWYSAIALSSGYIGELMHPVLVSLHNAVPVFVFDTYGFKRNGTLNQDSSKTLQILKRFGIEDNYYNRLLNEIPTPNKVFNGIRTFDTEKCKLIASELYNDYKIMMTKSMSI